MAQWKTARLLSSRHNDSINVAFKGFNDDFHLGKEPSLRHHEIVLMRGSNRGAFFLRALNECQSLIMKHVMCLIVQPRDIQTHSHAAPYTQRAIDTEKSNSSSFRSKRMSLLLVSTKPQERRLAMVTAGIVLLL